MRNCCALAFLLLFSFSITHAQKQWSLWPGMPSGVTFKTGSPQAFNTINNQFEFFKYNGGGVAYADPATGALKFIATGRAVYNSSYDTVGNGWGLIACGGDKYGVQVIPFPNGENKYYIFHSFPETNLLYGQEGGLQTRCYLYSHINQITSGLRYSVLDMDKNGGKGEIIQLNQYFQWSIMDRIALVKHANGKDTWLITHFWNSNTFSATLINSDGVQPSVFSNIGPTFTGKAVRCSGHIDASPDGKRLAATSGGSNTLELYDFDNETGAVSNYRDIQMQAQPWNVCFSPDNTKLYVSTSETITCGYRYRLYQFDFYESDLQNSIFRVFDSGQDYISLDMERAPDNKIYIGGKYIYYDDRPTQRMLYAITQPNQPKNACMVKAAAFLADGQLTFPNLINDQVVQAPAPQAINFNFPREVSVCFGTYTLTAPAGYAEYRWSNGAATRSITVNEAGLYSVVAGTMDFTKPQAYGYTQVVSQGKSLDFGKDTSVCPGTSFQLHIPWSYTNVLWQDGDTSHIHSVSAMGGKQRVTTLDANGCKTWDSVCVYYKYYPKAAFGKDTMLCTGQTLQLRLEPSSIFSTTPVQYAWSNGATTETLDISKAGNYWGKVTFEGCTVTDTIGVKFMDAEAVNLGNDTMLCKGDTLRLSADAGAARYEWSTGESASAIVVRNSGSYWVKVYNGACTLMDTIQVTFSPPPKLSIGRDTLLCENETLTLSSNIGNATYLWNNGAATASIQVDKAGAYWLQAKKDGCIVRDTATVTYKPRPQLWLGNDTTLCGCSSLLLYAASAQAETFLWNTGSTTADITISREGLYWVKAKGQNGCYAVDTIQVHFQSPPKLDLGRDTTLCEGQVLPLSVAVTDATFLWNDNNTEKHTAIRKAGTYWVQVTQNGCSSRDTIKVGYKRTPIVNLGVDTTLCEGVTYVLDATFDGAHYKWNDGATLPTKKVTKPGWYSVKAMRDGCVGSDTVQVKYKLLPLFTLGHDTVLCEGQRLTLEPHVANASYAWQDGTTASTYTITRPGLYNVTVSNECGSRSDDIAITGITCSLLMPTAFTPNNDGLNDLFKVPYPQFIKTFKMAVYNRWGQIVYQSTDAGKGWNGTYRNVEQPIGNYMWMIWYTHTGGERIAVKGNVFLVR